ncbi:ferritin-like domain-containing protein [Sneathiella sp. HT1-7]|uniref:ferritin-like domain-containing protein n=1 Tax=Sneathiella sp. HT1-7 TaxID=2887192 RepID=UPI001D13DF5D|nr:hypothetical protein [Sneathiella sp. HT1-7]MCC3305892.1 hypothetical protein [Sneathiella sp. HT1-7]
MSEQLQKILDEALEDEYKARATYAAIIKAFGPVKPFVNIVESEGRHAAALLQQYQRLGLKPPHNSWAAHDTKVPATLREACEEAIAAEIENAEMYERLLKATEDATLHDVLSNLRDSSQTRHLPAFRRCLERESR